MRKEREGGVIFQKYIEHRKNKDKRNWVGINDDIQHKYFRQEI